MSQYVPAGRWGRTPMKPGTITRSALGLGCAALVSLSCSRGSSRTATSGYDHARRVIDFVTDEVTRSSVDVSPDGRTVAFDMLGDIYTVPIEGGDAVPILTGPAWDMQPKFSPDGAQVAFVSDRAGTMALWTATSTGANPRLYPALPALRVGHGRSDPPSWMFELPRAEWLKSTHGVIYNDTRSPMDRDLVVYVAASRDSGARLVVLDRRVKTERILLDSVSHPDVSTSYAPGIPTFAFTPDGKSVVIAAQGKLQRVEVATGVATAIPFRARVRQVIADPITPNVRVADNDEVRARVLRWTSMSRDGLIAVFASLGRVYVCDLATGGIRPLTSREDRAYAPSLSPDGRWVAYVTWSDSLKGRVVVAPLTGGTPVILALEPGRYANPAWSPDGGKIAFVRDISTLGSTSPGNFEILWAAAFDTTVDARTAAITREVSSSLLRYFPTVAFSPDGERLYFTETPLRGDDLGIRLIRNQRLVSVRLDGGGKREHLRFRKVDEVAPSPDGRHVALAVNERIMIAELPADHAAAVDLDLDGPSANVNVITPVGGTYLSWRDARTLTWNAAHTLYSYELGAAKPQAVRDVDLRVRRARPDGVVAFTNARIVTMRGNEVISQGTIVVDKDRMVGVGGSVDVNIPADARIIDVSGATIVPGFADVHLHSHYTHREIFLEQRSDYVASLAFGVTTTYDPAAPTLDVMAQAELVEVGAMIGPRVFSSGTAVSGEDHGRPEYIPIQSLSHARRLVQRYSKYRPALLKEYMQPRREQRQWLARAAREAGMRITGEGRDLTLDLTLVIDGYTAFEHGMWPPGLYDDVIQFIARAGVHWTPTLHVSRGQRLEVDFIQRERPHTDARLRRFYPPHQLRGFAEESSSEPILHAVGWMDDARAAARIVRAGGHVSTGSHSRLKGIATHWEMWGLAAGGLTNHQALRAATLAPAQKLGMQRDIGSIEVGKLADFVVLDANPLDNIRNSVSTRYVVVGGNVYEADTMTQIWPVTKPLPRLYWSK